ncbi:rhomboid protein 2 [Alternaria rosae]|uniref:rhomboid protein 2 n=1 Tax=Alternaria rosae TaxID=1187941 RepID=UPI001E8CAE2A|nr:rhomboid protein 2 [Alternaria rosae]KAH6872635.1 rhomboid protein 2 [Alternaria rosae]
MPISSIPQISPARIRSYILRLPFCTKVLVAAIVGLWVATIPFPWIRDFGALEPAKMDLTQMHRLNLFPVLHWNFIHMIFNLVAVTPLIERFESEYGTLVTLALFTGPFGTIPGGVYTLLEKYVLRSNTSVMGASVWVFLLLSAEVMKTHKANPYFSVGPYKIPTWTMPLILIVLTSILVPYVSLVGHLCGAGLGYLWASGYIKFLVPHEKILRWVETKLNLLGRLPHYVSVDQKTYGRYGVLPTTSVPLSNRTPDGGQRLGP